MVGIAIILRINDNDMFSIIFISQDFYQANSATFVHEKQNVVLYPLI